MVGSGTVVTNYSVTTTGLLPGTTYFFCAVTQNLSGTAFGTVALVYLELPIRAGILPAPLVYLEERTVGPSLGADSVRAGVTAAFGGLLLVTLFMLFYYRLAGFNALISIAVNLTILLGLLLALGLTAGPGRFGDRSWPARATVRA